MSAGEVKPVLLTEAEVRRDLTDACVGLSEIERLVRKWSERGLIAPEPEVDPLLVEAQETCARLSETDGWYLGAKEYRKGERDETLPVKLALAALRRGMELGRSDPVRPELTRERVREALLTVFGDVQSWADAYAPELHAALTDGGRDG